jgi:cyclopropane fatty-acyl-phospholipid synthase-like methyltransferase
MYRLAPGHILQFLYVKQRLRGRGFRTFIDVGAGNGYLSRVLLALGLKGSGFDLNPSACDNNRALNAKALASGGYAVRCADFLTTPVDHVDLIVSSMMVEHLTETEAHAYFSRCRVILNPGGTIVTIAPASPRHWGIEDEIAGHQRRYTRTMFHEIARDHALRVTHIAGLTYPLSNLLLGFSNRLVRRSESWKLEMDAHARTLASGDRHVRGKTEFPAFMRYLVNEVTLFPLHLVQRLFTGHPDALVLYAEMEAAG